MVGNTDMFSGRKGRENFQNFKSFLGFYVRCYTFLANAEVTEACRASPGNDDARHVLIPYNEKLWG